MKLRVSSFDSVRACCALMVMANHLYTETGIAQNHVVFGLLSFPVEAVVGFFVLSGCLIAWQDYGTPARYLRARWVRIVPVYLIVLTATALAMLACGVAVKAGNFAMNVAFLQSFYWQPLLPLSFLAQSWSLSYEFWYYIIFIAVMLAPRLLLPLFLAALAVGIGWYLVPGLPGPLDALTRAFAFLSIWLTGVWVTRLWHRGHSVGLATGVYMLVLGACLARLPFSSPAKFDFGRLFLFGVGFAFFVSSLLPEREGKPRFELGLVTRFVLTAITLAALWRLSSSDTTTKAALSIVLLLPTVVPVLFAGAAQRVLRPLVPALAYVGGLSYALYLVHYPILQVFNATHVLPPVAVIPAVILLSLPLAHLLDYVLQPWLRARLR